MKPTPIAAAVLAALPLLFASTAHAAPAVVDVYLFEGTTPLPGVQLQLNDTAQPATAETGGARLSVPAGTHTLAARAPDGTRIEIPLTVADDETVQISAALYPDRAPAYRLVSSISGETQVDLSQTESAALTGRVVDAQSRPVADAEISINGVVARTDADGRYVLKTRPGTYPLLASASGFAFASQPGTALAYGDNTAPDMILTAVAAGAASAAPSASDASTLEGVTVEETIQQEDGGEFELAVERRETAQVIDTLSIDQISRAGDSDAAGALKRVTGLSLVDDKFVYVRGLGERYSSVLLNGAQIPSPDPTRRVVPLDLFPADILSSIAVQKTYSPDMPGEFGGGTVQMRTRGVPDAFLLRASGTLGYVDGTTGENGLRSRGGARDWLGRDDGFRDAPDGLFQRPLPPRNSADLATLGRGLTEKGFGVGRKDIGPDTGFGLAVGNRFGDDEIGVGFLGAVRYAQGWDQREEDRAEFSTDASGALNRTQDYRREKTERAIDTSVFLSVGADLGADHHLTGTALQVRQTEQEDSIDEGLRSSGNVERSTRSEWMENELTVLQLNGEHRFDAAGDLEAFWQYTDSSAERDMPFARSYLYSQSDDGFVYTSSFPAQVRYEFLEDGSDEMQLGLRYPLQFGEGNALTFDLGGSRLRRDRDSAIWRYNFRTNVAPPRTPTPIDDILNPGAIDSGAIELVGVSSATDFYTAEQSLDALYLNTDLRLGDWRLNLGAREERNDQRVVTQNPFLPGSQPLVGALDRSDLLPSAALTWMYSDSAQLRLGYNETVSRPEFRELSTAPFTDPLLDITVFGNPDLEQADIQSLDLRWEYYFSDMESVSVGVFRKEFDDPIELVRVAGSSDVLTLNNADAADVQGIEFDLSRSLGGFEEAGWLPAALRGAFWQDLYVSANYAWIDSEVDLGDNAGIQTSTRRPLQGQSRYIANVALTWFDPEGRGEATLLYNVAGERVSSAGQSGLPDIYEQPFHQLDFTYGRALAWDGWKWKLRLRNLLDPKAEFTQGGEVSRSYRKGREIAFTLEWKY